MADRTDRIGRGAGTRQDELAGELDEYRLALASAADYDSWHTTYESLSSAIRRPPRDDFDRLRLANLAGLAAYQRYLLGPPVEEATETITAAEEKARTIGSTTLRLRAMLALGRARHRLARNTYAAQALRETGREMEKLIHELQRRDPSAEELFNWRLERANWHRYRGNPARALHIYHTLLDHHQRLAPTPSRLLRVCVLLHYQVSVYCDFLELTVLPPMPGLPKWVTMTGAAADAMRRRLLAPPLVDSLPLLGAYNRKHASLISAVTGEFTKATHQLLQARNVVRNLKLLKPVLLCDLFEALLGGLAGDEEGATQQLEDVARRASAYHPRAASKALLHAASFQLRIGQAGSARKLLDSHHRAVGAFADCESGLMLAELHWLERIVDSHAYFLRASPPHVPIVVFSRVLAEGRSSEASQNAKRWVRRGFRRLASDGKAEAVLIRSVPPRDGAPSLKDESPREERNDVEKPEGFELDEESAAISERLLERLSPLDLIALETLDHGKRDHFREFNVDERAGALGESFLERLSPEDRASLETLDHGKRDHFREFVIEVEAEKLFARGPANGKD